MLRTDSGGERECNLIQLRDLSHFWPAQLWKEICPGLWHHSLLHAGTVSWSTDAVGFVCVFGTWSCDNELGKVLWVSYRTDVTVSGDGYLLTKGRIRSAFIGICLMWLSLLLDETRPNAAILRYLVETTSYFSAFVTSFFFFLPPSLLLSPGFALLLRAVAHSPPTSQTAFSCHDGLVFPASHFNLSFPAMADHTFCYKSGSHPGLVHTSRSYL